MPMVRDAEVAAPVGGPAGIASGRRAADILDVLDAPEGLSIVLQGAVVRDDAQRLADYCARWRTLFPAAQIVFAVSSSDCLAVRPGASAPVERLEAAADLAGDERLVAALAAIRTAVDVVVFGREEHPLPPMKSDSPGPNNINLMIAAAQAGLAWATGRYTLRIRNDLLFADRTFVDLYAGGLDLPRGPWRVFAQRVMLSEVFTLNPLTFSRMPFHYSDWFHFGLSEDIRRLWQPVRPMSVDDSSFYESQPHLPSSNEVERRFRSRLAPEQMVSFPVFRQHFPCLRLEHHNDLSSVEESLFVLADNFVVANLAACHARIDKYQNVVDRMSIYTRLECITQGQVRERATHRGVPSRDLFADVVRRTARYESWPAEWRRAVRRVFFRTLYRLRSLA